jgi:hypothetical protein
MRSDYPFQKSDQVPLLRQHQDAKQIHAGFIVASPMSLSFGNQTVNTTSAPQTVTLTNTGDEPVTNANDFYFDCYASLDGFNGVTD